jgi:hypothetical protein
VDEQVLTPEQTAAVRQLVDQATTHIGRSGDSDPLRALLRRVSRGRLGRRRGWPQVVRLDTPWQDTICVEREGWRTRSAHLPPLSDAQRSGENPGGDDPGGEVFAVDYVTCRRCALGWVEQPHTIPAYQRRGLAAAGLAALRAEHPGLAWHTLGGHFRDSEPFWAAAGAGVPGGYQQRHLCPHLDGRPR